MFGPKRQTGDCHALQAIELSEYTLTSHLGMAVRASNAQYDVPDVIDRLRVRLPPGTGFETGVLQSLTHITVVTNGHFLLCACRYLMMGHSKISILCEYMCRLGCVCAAVRRRTASFRDFDAELHGRIS